MRTSAAGALGDLGDRRAVSPLIRALADNRTYDAELCATAQRVILNAAPEDYTTITLRAAGTTFITEQIAKNDLIAGGAVLGAMAFLLNQIKTWPFKIIKWMPMKKTSTFLHL